MFGLSLGHLIILTVVLLIFGGRRIPELGGALGRGIRAFKKGLEGVNLEDESQPPSVTHATPSQIEHSDPSDKKTKA